MRNCASCGFENPEDFRYCGRCGAPLSLADGLDVAPEDMAPAERRQLTVVFCDLVGSTGLSTRLDPEQYRRLVGRYRTACAGAIHDQDGHVAQYLGDGIVAYFGYPAAMEDAAEKAVIGARGVLEAVRKLGSEALAGTPVEVRIGIATGTVVAETGVGEGFKGDRTAIGETPNLAARLQTLARPGEIVISDHTRRIVGRLFDLEEVSGRDLKGFERPITAWRVVGESHYRRRFDALSSRISNPFAGRSNDLRLLTGAWQTTCNRSGQVVLISGDAGIGKSRLVREFENRIRGSEFDEVVLQCSPRQTATVLYPIVRSIHSGDWKGLGAHLESQTAASRSEGGAAAFEMNSNVESVLADLLEGDRSASSEVSSLPASARKARTFAVLRDLLLARIEERPLLIVLEDAHWIDPTTREFLESLERSISTLPIMILATFRDGYYYGDAGSRLVSRLHLDPLDKGEARLLIEDLVSDRDLPSGIDQEIIERADGVPLFIEELTRSVLDRVDDLGAVPSGISVEVPGTLADSLMARLDRLGEAKRVAQIGSIMGRTFTADVVAAIASTIPLEAIHKSLKLLVDSDVVRPSGAGQCQFRHALFQETAHSSLLFEDRRRYHGAVVELWEADRLPGESLTPGVVAHHAIEAGDPTTAISYLRAAATRAAEQSANLEAIAHLERALGLIGDLSEEDERLEQELALMIALGAVRIALLGPGSRETEAAYSRALEICEVLPPSEMHFAAQWGWWRVSLDFATGRERAQKLIDLAESLDDDGLRMQAHHSMWASLFMLGEQAECADQIECGMHLYDPKRHVSHATVYGGHDARVCALGESASSLWLRGFPDSALKPSGQGLEWADSTGHAGSVVHALDYAINLRRYRREPTRVIELTDRLASHADYWRFPDYGAKARIFRGWALAQLGEIEEGLFEVRGGLDDQRQIGTKEDLPVYLDILGELYWLGGHDQEGAEVIDHALEEAMESGIRFWDAELYRRRGEFAANTQDREAALAHLENSLRIADMQGAVSLRLRTATSLCRILADAALGFGGDQLDAARDLLSSTYDSFTEGFDTLDLIDARNVIETTVP